MKSAIRTSRVSLLFLFLLSFLAACDTEPIAPTPPPSTPTILPAPTSTLNPPTLIPTSLPFTPTPLPTSTPIATPDSAATSTAFVAQDPWKQVSVITDVRVLAFAPGDPRIIYAGVSHYDYGATTGGMARSTDSGQTWQALPSTFQANHISVAPSDPSIVYAGTKLDIDGGIQADCPNNTPGELYRTSDGGETWSLLSGSAYNIDINPNDPDHLVGLQCSGLVRSIDGGMTWQPLPNSGVPNLSAGYMARSSSARSTIYVAYANFAEYEGGGIRAVVRRTTDDGLTWTTLPFKDCRLPYDLVIDPADARHVYLPCSSAFFVSTDSGDTWTAHNGGLFKSVESGDPAPYPMSELALDLITKPPSGASPTLYMFHVVFETTSSFVRWNGVDTWEKIGEPPRLTSRPCCLLMLNDPASPALLTATADGIYKRLLP